MQKKKWKTPVAVAAGIAMFAGTGTAFAATVSPSVHHANSTSYLELAATSVNVDTLGGVTINSVTDALTNSAYPSVVYGDGAPNALVSFTFNFDKGITVTNGEQIVIPFKSTGYLGASVTQLPSTLKNSAGQVLFNVSKDSAGNIVFTATSVAASLKNLKAEMSATVAFTTPTNGASNTTPQPFGFTLDSTTEGYTLQPPVKVGSQSNSTVVDNNQQTCNSGLQTSFQDGVDWSAIQNAILNGSKGNIADGFTPNTDFYVWTKLSSPHATTFTVGNMEDLDTIYGVDGIPQFTNGEQYFDSMASNSNGSFTTSSTPLSLSDAEAKADSLTTGQWTGTTGTESNGDSYASIIMNLGSVANPSNVAPLTSSDIASTVGKVNSKKVTLTDVMQMIHNDGFTNAQPANIVDDNITATITDSKYQNTVTNLTATSIIVYKNAAGQWVELDPTTNQDVTVSTCPANAAASGSASGDTTPDTAPTGSTDTVTIGTKIDAQSAVGNESAMPSGTTYSWKTPADTSTPGTKSAVVQVTYPDGTTATAPVTVNVIPNGVTQTVNVGTTPSPQNSLQGLSSMPATAKYAWKNSPDTSTPGVKNADVTVTFPDKSTETVPVTVNVVPAAQTQTVTVGATVSPKNSLKDVNDMPSGTTYTWQSSPDTSTAGTKKAVVAVTFPDGTTKDVNVTVNVTAPTTTTKPATSDSQKSDTTSGSVPSGTQSGTSSASNKTADSQNTGSTTTGDSTKTADSQKSDTTTTNKKTTSTSTANTSSNEATNKSSNKDNTSSTAQATTAQKAAAQKKVTATESSALAKTGASVVAVVVAMLAFFGLGILLKKRHRKDDSAEE